ncbi:hypothetical protein [Actinacidiphila acidipaludis]|uniref:Uncharacterized protein n=1 Tax=Actinacidiphila acidipaludis TaxID=2873382 RepID=A0ABS7Q4J6_9ACTN|nr:hypothetical protein [Streptomyces acidipaludis]MBY8877639.1 hypothetical protein [Streptomyces acidipaludis]
MTVRLRELRALAARVMRPGGDAFCRHCDQAVKPVVRRNWAKAAWFVATAEVFGVIVSIVACFTPVDPWKSPRRWLACWPAAIHPAVLGVVAAVLAALGTAWFADFLNEWVERTASCPKCRRVLAAPTGPAGI